MVNDAVETLLSTLGLAKSFKFRPNAELTTRHGHRLKTYTFEPSADPHSVLYSPASPLHAYKRFAGFPPISTELLQYYKTSGLEGELKRVVSSAYDAMKNINDTKTFLSANPVLTVLMRPYEPSDTFYVVSRNDRPTGFWTQNRRDQYVAYLRANAKANSGTINQHRAWVYDSLEGEEQEPGDSIYRDLRELQKPGTLKSFPVNLVNNFERISELIFGFTLSTKHRYAIIPVPGLDFYQGELKAEQIGEMLRPHIKYTETDGPMRAIITADEEYVGLLIDEFDSLMANESGTTSA
jgi:hypothetical protein